MSSFAGPGVRWTGSSRCRRMGRIEVEAADTGQEAAGKSFQGAVGSP